MNESLAKAYDVHSDIYGFPQNYKGIDFYPLKMKDYKMQGILYSIFTYPKHVSKDKMTLKMSYFKFVYFVLKSERKEGIQILTDLLEFLTKRKVSIISQLNDEEMIAYEKSLDRNDPQFLQNLSDEVVRRANIKILFDDIEIAEKEFDDIREILLEQNGLTIEYVNEYNEVFEEKLKRSKGIDFKDQFFAFANDFKKLPDEILNMTVWQYNHLVEKWSTMRTYDLYTPLEVSGQIDLKGQKIPHYLQAPTKKGRYDSILISKERFVEKNKGVFE